ncbi:sensor histidine kinase [Actinomadura rudentiformis]|uniref:histidine kinase n=1 Tax=Actinomadura rudentiformis TaxID=359158 RepID=A0A6H9Y5P5_9ACTN|nr:nitrate- and nitrite sensing domain-containing protein [Actinomadura rudentiformis]KAB2339329.1 HAMP domain-containing protein [Actinomadura rudentiformis]
MGTKSKSRPPGPPGAAARQKARENPGGTRRRGLPIRLRITVLLLVPLMSLVALWGFAANITLGPAIDKYDFSTTYEKVGLPGLFLVNQLQQERSLSVVAVSTRKPADKQKLGAQRARASAVQDAFRKSAFSPEATDAAKADTGQRLAEAMKALDRLPALRAKVDTGQIGTLELIESYGNILDRVILVFSGLVIVNDLDIFEQGRALISVGNARAYMLRQDALISAALAKGGRLSDEEKLAFAEWAAIGRREFQVGLVDMNDDLRRPLQQLGATPNFQRYRAIEEAVINSRGDRLPPEVAEWSATVAPLSQAWEQKVTQASLALNELAKPIGERVVRRLVLVGGFGLFAVVASVLLSIFAARSLSRELRGLQRAALQLAEDRLPNVVARLRRGEEVDVEAEAPPLIIGKTREVSRVGDAFTRVQHTAIETAVRESYLREGISRVFLNVAWRSQSLLHRQLRMLDEMERRATDPDVMADLFRLDHLTTRMRRHAEGLVILSGASPGRGWSRPVPVEDVMRAAIAEVEDYTRVEVVVLSAEAALIGEAVADVVHLLAELIENATVFSPAPTEVLVRGEMGANGFAVDIVDRGIGLDQAELNALNLRLSRAPEFDLAVTDRLGLFVVARLAGRHGIRVALQPSVYGGVSAVVLIPRELMVDIDQPEDERESAINGSNGVAADGVPAPRQAPDAMPNGSGPSGGNGHTPSTADQGNGQRQALLKSKAMLNAPTPFDAPASPVQGTGADAPPSFGTPAPPAAPDPSAPPAPSPSPGSPEAPTWTSNTPEAPTWASDTPAWGNETPTWSATDTPRWGTEAPTWASEPADRPSPFSSPVSFGEPMATPHAQPGSGSRAPLPRRTRRASLAPQLRSDEPSAAYQPDDTLVAWEERSAEASRDLFADLQAGWMRGRDEDEGPSDYAEGRGGPTS